jgi:type II secretory pathway pseudopilin PulG
MLMTIGIILFLAAVLVVAIGQAGRKAREEATRATITKISNQVQERLESLDRLKSQQQWAADVKKYAAALGFPPDPEHIHMANVLLLKMRVRAQFPQSFVEYATPPSTPDPNPVFAAEISRLTPPDYATWLSSHPTHNPETESSALLYFILTSAKGFGVPTVDPGEYKASEVADTDGDGLLEFIDAWGKPLRFYRWPTRLFATGQYDFDSSNNSPNSPIRAKIDRSRGATILFKELPTGNPDPLARDEDDPTFALPIRTQQDAENFEQDYHTPFTSHPFLIVSSGPDGQKKANPNDAFGLYPPTYVQIDPINAVNSVFGNLAQPIGTPAGLDAMTDNITNRNR